MTKLTVAVVSRDPTVRLAAARAFDHAPPSWSIRLHESAPREADVLVFGSDLRQEAEGGIVFDPGSRQEVVEEVRRSVLEARAKVFLVCGAGRGVGSTSLALHLAAAAAAEHTTCFVDLDVEWGAAGRLGIESDYLTWRDAGTDAEALRLAALPVAGGFRALFAPRVAHSDETGAQSEGLAKLIGRAGALFDRCVLDCPSSVLRAGLLESANAAVLIVPPTPPGAHRALTVLEAHPTTSWALVLNRLGPGGETTRSEMHAILGRRCVLELPCTPALRDSEDDGKLLTGSFTRYRRAVSRLLRALETAG